MATTEDVHDWIPLRWRDIDALGHVYHAEFLTLLDEARTRWFRTVLGLRDPDSYVLVHVEIDYESPLDLADGKVRVDFAVERIGTSSLTLTETMHAPDGRVVSRSRSVTVRWERPAGRSRALTDDERERARAQMDGQPAAEGVSPRSAPRGGS